MKFKTCYNSISFCGYKIDILKSAVQKYLRRREFDKMIWCVGEIYLFKVLAKSDKEKKVAKAIISNLLNRLIIMLDEEIMFIECEKYVLIRNLMEEFENSNRSKFSILYKICFIMVNAKIIRRNSDIRTYWSSKIDKNKKTDEYYFEKFKEKFVENNCECFKWMFNIYYNNKKGNKLRFRRKDNIYMVWEYLLNLDKIKNNDILKKCLNYKLKEFFIKDRHERPMFITSAIDIAMYIKTNNFNNTKLTENEINKLNNINIIGKVFGNWDKLKIDDYAIDMHTSDGRKNGKNKIDFIKSGGIVINEDKEYFVKEWRDYYIESKKTSKKTKKNK